MLALVDTNVLTEVCTSVSVTAEPYSMLTPTKGAAAEHTIPLIKKTDSKHTRCI